LLLVLGACARYAPAPLDLDAAPAAYRARSLSDPALLAALDSIGVPAPERWTEWSLAHAAWLMRPERDRLLAEVRAAEAAVVSAGGRPAPGVAGGVEGTFSGKDGTSPWAVALSGLFRVELGGKRGARIARAEAGVMTARLRAELAGWQFRTRVRQLGWEWRAALEARSHLQLLLDMADEVTEAYQRRYASGIVGASELARIWGERDGIQAELIAARRAETEAELRFREESGLDQWELVPRAGVAEPECDSLTPDTLDALSRLALTSRPELAVVLAEYQESEADVRIAVAASWPDLELGPGLLYDHGAGKWTIGFGLPGIPVSYRGPLGEAVARREVQAARVAEVQAAVLAEVDRAVRGCEAAWAAHQELGPAIAGAEARVQAALAARDRGETDAVPMAQARVDRERWSLLERDAQARRVAAAHALDRAVGVWNPGTNTTTEGAGD
jgi:CRISPR system Cascade subunit CasA